jgi:hypothetical protein
MFEEKKIAALAAHFRALGADEPEQWATSQVREKIPQYGRFLFVRAAWENVISEDDESWIDDHVDAAGKDPNAPLSGVGIALKRLLELGASRRDLVDIVRGAQYETMFGMLYQLSDPDVVNYPNADVPHVNWALAETTEDGHVLHALDALHENALTMDPTGREMRPRGGHV